MNSEIIFIGIAFFAVIALALLFYRGLLKRKEIAGKTGLSPEETKRNHLIRSVSGVFLAIFLVSGFLLPVVQNYEEAVFHTSDVLFLIDESRSMAAEKIMGYSNRLERAKSIMVEFSRAFPDLNLSIYGFTREVRSHLYWTTDYNDFWRTIEQVIRIEGVPTNGTDLGKAIERTVNYFPEDSESKIIVLLSDGENQNKDSDFMAALNLALGNNVRIIVIGVGEIEGSTIPMYNQKGEFIGLERVAGRNIVTYLREPLLKDAAEKTEGLYVKEDSVEEAFWFLDKQLIEKKREVYTQDTTLRMIFLVLSLIPLYFLTIKNW